jgi:hypothetical protein
MTDVIPGQADPMVLLPEQDDLGSVRVIITQGSNAYMLQVVLKQNSETRLLVGREVTSYAVAETVARVFAATHGVSWDKVEVVSG